MKTVILGGNSDIAQLLKPSLGDVTEYHHEDFLSIVPVKFDLLLVACGKMTPTGPFQHAGRHQWDACIMANALMPLRGVREIYPYRNGPDASIVFFAGDDPNKPNPGHSAYHLSKIMLIAAAEQLNAEFDCKVFILGPGYVRTKIHPQKVEGLTETRPEELQEMLATCMAYPKAIIGGRNIHIRDNWRYMEKLKDDDYRLRRHGPR